MRVTVAQRRAADGEASSAVRRILRRHADFHGITDRDEVFNQPSGAPYCTLSEAHISLSHDEDWVAAATSTAPVGVDIQRAIDVSPRFIRGLGCISTTEAAASWCVREAIAKVRGKGLSDAPWRYDLHINQLHGQFQEVFWLCVPLRNTTFLAAASARPCVLVLQEVPDDDIRSADTHIPGPDHQRSPRSCRLDSL
ncbi:hypothetical protein AB0J48_34085 [Nocardia salmonicida]|uniref:4'-phosphopantetheinyl transferase family protein n=1 Tax=Nocardia salmonicida TaxID=53431 RepID=UPI00341A1D45